jgi:hypothetical protein
MTRTGVLTAILAVLALSPAAAQDARRQKTITFEGIDPRGTCCTRIHDGFRGFDWRGIFVADHEWTDTPTGYDHGVVSGRNVAGSFTGGFVTMRRDEAFDLFRVFVTAAYREEMTVGVRGYRDGVELFHYAAVVGTAGPTLFELNFTDVDAVTFQSAFGTPSDPGTEHFVLDNLSYHATTTPEPATLGLIGSGVLGLAAARRKRRAGSPRA